MSSGRPRVFYGWWIVLTSLPGLFFGAPVTVFSFGIFFRALGQEFHAGRAAVSLAFTIHNIVGALWLPAWGRLIDRFGARHVILPMSALYGLLLLSARWLGHSIWHFYLFYAVLGVAVVSQGPVAYGVVISHWFNRRRGLALGMMGLSIGIGAFTVPLLAQRLIPLMGWRAAYAVFGAGVLLLSIPAVAVLLRDDPAECGLQQDGEEAPASGGATVPALEGMSWNEIWHSPTFWIMIVVFSVTGASVHAGILHMPALLTDRGLTAGRAALASSVIGISLMMGRVSCGYLLDYFFAPYIAVFFFGASAAGLAILWTGQSGVMALAAAFLVGLGMGSEVELMAYLMSRYFGLRAFASAYGHVFAAFMISGALGTLMMGAGFDRFHSYSVPLGGFCIAMVGAIVLLAKLGPYRYGVKAEASLPLEPVSSVSGA